MRFRVLKALAKPDQTIDIESRDCPGHVEPPQVMSHRRFLKTLGLAFGAAGVAQFVRPAEPALASQIIQNNVTVTDNPGFGPELSLVSQYGTLEVYGGYSDSWAYVEAGNAGWTGNANGLKIAGYLSSALNSLQLIASTVYVSGNLGIGTTNPGYPLEIVHNSAPQLVLRGSWVGGAGLLRFQETNQPGFWEVITRNAGTNQIGEMDWYSNPDGGLSPSHYHQYMAFLANNNLDTSPGTVYFPGNVGIGTAAPATALHLNSGAIQIGTIKIADSSGCYYA